MMWRTLAILLVLACGCRREDIRQVTLNIPGLTAENQQQVAQALTAYGGVRADSFTWDLAAKTLTLRYDSMQVAQTNLRMAIEEKGIKVEYPKKSGNRAGY